MSWSSRLVCCFAPLAAAAIVAGCSSAGRVGPYAPLAESERNTDKAQKLTQEGAAALQRDPAKAERLFREALTVDLFHGPAHNNLGVVYLKQKPPRLYEAAGEFEWARKLMPGLPDPRVNLAMTLEQAGRFDEALSTYATALEVYPDYLPAIQGIARLQLRHDREDDRTGGFLREIAMRGESERWRDWARLELSKREAAGGLPGPP